MNNLEGVTDKDLALFEDAGFTRDSAFYWSKRISNVPCPLEISSEGLMNMVIHIQIPFNKSGEWEVSAWVRSHERSMRFLYLDRLKDAVSVSEILEWCGEQESKFRNNELKLNGKKIGYKDGLKWKLQNGEWALGDEALIIPHFENSFGAPVQFIVYVRDYHSGIYCKTWNEALAKVHEHYPLVVLED